MKNVKIGNLDLGPFPLLLAPMEDVSDPPFRVLCKEQGADFVFTEFISSEGLIRSAEKSLKKLEIFEGERPVGIQIFGSETAPVAEAARIANNSEPELVDINFGCPVKKVACKGAGAGILKNLPMMQEITKEVVKACDRPVTVKTRLGWDHNTIQIKQVALMLQDAGIQALTIHGRTRNQMYKGHADWSYIADVKSDANIHIPIFGNGDIDSPQKALEYKNQYGVDGIMIGRAAIGYPWIFREIKHYLETGELLPPPTLTERVNTCKRHLQMEVDWKGEKLGILEMRRHYTNYFKGLPGIKTFRNKIVTTEDLNQIFDLLDQIDQAFSGYDMAQINA